MSSATLIPEPPELRRTDETHRDAQVNFERSVAGTPSDSRMLLRWAAFGLLTVALHGVVIQPDEPVFGGDSNRHVMTGVFFRDLLIDGDLTHPKQYAERYFEQYPALGLLIWPPLFHGITGVAMTLFGTSVVVPRLIVLAFYLVAVILLYRLLRRRCDARFSQLVVMVFALSPLVFEYSRHVMLEMPTLALCLLSVQQFDVWMCDNRHRSLYLAALAAAGAALTRFDAVVLLPAYLLILILHRPPGDHVGGTARLPGSIGTRIQQTCARLFQRHVIAATLLAIAVVAPPYAIILREVGDLHLRQAAESVGLAEEEGDQIGFLSPRNFLYYPSCLPEQASWPATAFLVIGMCVALRRPVRHNAGVFWALLVSTYLVFTPLAELRSRHAIYWLPAVAFFAVVGADTVARWLQRRTVLRFRRLSVIAVYGLLIGGPVIASYSLPDHRVTGYRQAAEFVLQRTPPDARVFFDGWWDGNFTYHVRSLDESRSRHVVRGDRLLYDFTCVPDTDFRQFVETNEEILTTLTEAKLAYVVLEQPQFFYKVEIAERLRDVVAEHPEVFELVESIPVQCSNEDFPPFRLEIYRVVNGVGRPQSGVRDLETDAGSGPAHVATHPTPESTP